MNLCVDFCTFSESFLTYGKHKKEQRILSLRCTKTLTKLLANKINIPITYSKLSGYCMNTVSGESLCEYRKLKQTGRSLIQNSYETSHAQEPLQRETVRLRHERQKGQKKDKLTTNIKKIVRRHRQRGSTLESLALYLIHQALEASYKTWRCQRN